MSSPQIEDEFLAYLQQQGQQSAAPSTYGGGADDPGTTPYGYTPTYDTYIPNLSSGQNADPYIPAIGKLPAPQPAQQGQQQSNSAPMFNPQPGNPRAAATPGATGKIAQYIREAALKRGIDPEVALRIAEHEGGYDDNDPARMGTFATGKSWWPFQLHYGGAGTPYASYGTQAGMGNDFSARTGYKPGDPAAVYASIDFALDEARRSGWGKWYGRVPAGVGEWDGIPR